MEEEKQTSNVAIGTLYDMNKTMVEQAEKPLTEAILNSKKEELRNFLRKTKNQYYMLLCHEQRDYTIFDLGYENYISLEDKINHSINVLIDECLKNRGSIRGFDITEDKNAIEIWLSIDGESYAYYFFPYDAAVIDIEEEMSNND